MSDRPAWCGWRESNSHRLTPTTPSKWRVYHFTTSAFRFWDCKDTSFLYNCKLFFDLLLKVAISPEKVPDFSELPVLFTPAFPTRRSRKCRGGSRGHEGGRQGRSCRQRWPGCLGWGHRPCRSNAPFRNRISDLS